MQRLTVDVDEELFRTAKVKAVGDGVALREVVERLLRAYVDGKINVRPRERNGAEQPAA